MAIDPFRPLLKQVALVTAIFADGGMILYPWCATGG